MPHYVNDPENPGQHIDANELVRRNPLTPPPPDSRIMGGLLKRDTWTRREAIAILAGADPRHAREYFHGVPIPTGYLDGTTALGLQAAGLQHPLHEDISAACSMLDSYSEGQDMAEERAPSEWLVWADSKAFTPYWLDDAATEDSEEVARRVAGRYTLGEAAKEIAYHSRARWGDILQRLSAAWAAGDLPVFRPGSTADSTPENSGLHRYYMEAYWSDLNAWLAKDFPHFQWRFPAPTPAIAVEPDPAPAEQVATGAAQGTPAEQWKAAKGDMRRRAALAEAMVKRCQDNKTEAARRLGTHRQTIDRVLGKGAAHGAAGVAPMYAQLARKPHKT